MCVHDTDTITLREYVETYREESENEYPVSMLDVLRPLSKHSFVSYLATSSKREERAMYLPCTVFVMEPRSGRHRVIHRFSIVKRLKCLRHDEYLCASTSNYYQFLHRRRIFKCFKYIITFYVQYSCMCMRVRARARYMLKNNKN